MVADAPDSPISGNDTIADSSKDFRNRIFNEDCAVGLQRIPDKSIDLVMMDPPYDMETCGGGAFGSFNKLYHGELDPISNGITNEMLDLIVSKMKRINIYIWCNKRQIYQYLDYFLSRRGGGIHMDLLTWHKTNPVPTCGNKYLSDTEYCLFFREKGVKLYGSYDTKHTFYVTSLNTKDKKLYGHPTIKPLEIVRNLIGNSASIDENGTVPIVLDPFMGSGTTAVAAKELGFDYLGFEIDPEYHRVALERICNTKHETNIEDATIPAVKNTLDIWGISS